MTLAIMQPYLFPYIGYWQLINAVDIFVIYDDVNFINRGFINRNHILVDSKPKLITLELIGSSQNKLINQIEIGNNNIKILNIIKQNYKKAPFFNDVYPLIEFILCNDEKNLAHFIAFSLKYISSFLNINTSFVYSSDIEKNNKLKGQDKIIDICKNLHTKTYINAIGGMKLYDSSEFNKENIKLKFLQTKEIKYKQFKNEFIKNLSIIDILMFNEKKVIQKFLTEYKLIGAKSNEC